MPRTRIFLALLGFWLLANNSFGQDNRGVKVVPKTTPSSVTHLILIGVDEYEKICPLKFCVKDIQAYESVFSESTEKDSLKITKLVNQQVKAKEIHPAIEAAMKMVQKDDLLIFVFAGHGRSEGVRSFLLPVDFDPTRPEPTSYPMSKLRQLLADCKAVNKLVILDCCHAGGTRSDKPRPEASKFTNAVDSTLKNTNAVILASCGVDEEALEYQDGQHGLFTYHMIQGLKGMADSDGDQIIDSDDLYKYVKEQVPATIKKWNTKNSSEVSSMQIPRRLGDGEVNSIKLLKLKNPSLVSRTPVPAATLDPLDLTKGDIAEEKVKQLQQAWADKQKLSKTIQIDVRGQKIDFVYIPNGIFDLTPQCRVTLNKPIYMSVCEINQKTYQTLMGQNPAWFQLTPIRKNAVEMREVKNTDLFPIESVTWEQTQEFCKKLQPICLRDLNLKEVEVRLPTEAEWEFAARAGTQSAFSNRKNTLSDKIANFKESNFKRPIECGTLEANALGLKDMHGNVREWCQDVYEKELWTNSQTNPLMQSKRNNNECVIRGGSWNDDADNCRLDQRSKERKDSSRNYVGFRVVLVVTPK